jgi:predicted Zn-dependent protease
MNFTEITKENFNQISNFIIESLHPEEQANINLHAEDTTFIRFNNSKVRQNTHVTQKSLTLLLQKAGKSASVSFSISGDCIGDKARAQYWLDQARSECESLPLDPFQVAIQNQGSSDSNLKGHLLNDSEIFESLIQPALGSDMAGLYCGGPLIAANRNSLGQSHWFSTESFFMDYSLYDGQRAVKGVYAGTQWNQEAYANKISTSKIQLSLLNRPKITLNPGKYRTYLAPAAVAEIAHMFSWDFLSYNSFKKGTSALMKFGNNEKSFSPLFSVRENFQLGLNHRFNSMGELAPETLELITGGQLKNFLISSRSAKEYLISGNAADNHEAPRSLEITAGSLPESEILKKLETGLYLSNLHYLNWSDRMSARITGMTRYACFWVEKGEIIGPISDMRFDESLYDCLGENLLAVTDFQEIDPQVSTYDSRNLGGKKTPGIMIKDFKLTL